MNVLIDQISRVQVPELISYNIYTSTENHEQAITGLNGDFIHSLVTINALIRLEPFLKEKKDLISILKEEYKSNKNQLRMINEFNDKYTPDKAVWWYTRESFFYRLLNRTLCLPQNNFELLLLFHSYIKNIYEQLEQNQYKSAVRVYFSQLMWKTERDYLENSCTRCLAINSFLLTNINREKILNSIDDSNIDNRQKQVLFIIDADPTVGITKPFADISKIGHFIDEGAILFMTGSVFYITAVKEVDQILMIEMKLCGNNNEDKFKNISELMRKIYDDQDCNSKIDLLVFGDLLYRMGKYDRAEKIYRYLLSEHSSNDWSQSKIYSSLAAIAKEQREYDSSLELYQKSLRIKKRKNPSDFIMIGRLHACIGEVYKIKEKNTEALKYFKEAIELYQKNYAENHPFMADFHHNVASIYKRRREYDQALISYKEALRLGYEHSSSNQVNIAKSHNGLGNIYYFLRQYDEALEHYQLSLAIKLKVLSSDKVSIANTHKNIGAVYKMKNDLNEALTSYKNANDIYCLIFPSNHQDVKETRNEIDYLSERLKPNLSSDKESLK